MNARLTLSFLARFLACLFLLYLGGWNGAGLVTAAPLQNPPTSKTASVPGDENWDARFGIPGIDYQVLALECNGNTLTAGGTFHIAGNTVADHIAQWDGTAWQALGAGLPGSEHVIGQVSTVATYSGTLYAGGSWETISDLERYDGGTWHQFNIDGPVRALTVDGSDLYVGGTFSEIEGVSAPTIARWDGSTWHSYGAGVDGEVDAILVQGTDIYIGGNFVTTENSSVVNRIARWDGSHWVPVGGGVTGTDIFGRDGISALAFHNGNLYAAGHFTKAGGVDAANIARWDGAQWHALGDGIRGTDSDTGVSALTFNGDDLYAGGRFTQAGGVSVQSLARWDGTTWSAVGDSLGQGTYVLALASCNDQLFVGGMFNGAGTLGVLNVARWDGTQWHAVANANDFGLSGDLLTANVSSLAAWDGIMYVGGTFSHAGTLPINGIVVWKWPGWTAMNTVWAPCDYSQCSSATALAMDGQYLVAGGGFTKIGGVKANNIARWDGTRWQRLGRGVNGTVHAIAVHGHDIYVAGDFSQAGKVRANNIARWDGQEWHALGQGVRGPAVDVVYALVVQGSDLIVGGDFRQAGKVKTSNIAKWDGTHWSAVGGGVDGAVLGIDSSAGQLYTVGGFTHAGGKTAHGSARWDGANWHRMGGGCAGTAVAARNGIVYVGGFFDHCGNVPASQIAKWDGAHWSALGSGFHFANVNALAVKGRELWVGGDFTTAGDKVSSAVGVWNIPFIP